LLLRAFYSGEDPPLTNTYFRRTIFFVCEKFFATSL
jgi:hypothetical protein